jgi:outer membrane protein insertion porin family
MSKPSLRSRGSSLGSSFALVVFETAVGFAIAVGVLLAPAAAFALGETITDVRILDNQRTEESTIRSIAGVSRGDLLEVDTLDKVRERLNTAGLFSDVNVWWEPLNEGVRVNIAVKDKFPWAPVPTGSFSANNKSFGLLFVHGNLFGRGKQLAIGGRIATVDSGAVIAYRDPALFGSWIYWQMQAQIQRQVIPEYDNYGSGIVLGDPIEIRETHLFGYGMEPSIGIAWLRRVKTQVAWRLEQFNNQHSYFVPTDGTPSIQTTDATNGGVVGIGRASLTFDFRAREFSVMRGAALYMGFDVASPTFKSDFSFWRAGASWEHGIRLFREHNFVYYVGANAGHNLPFWLENTAGGPNLRGYLFQQFRGDTAAFGKVEYHFPLFSIRSLDFRALAFYDAAAVWFRDSPSGTPVTDPVLGTSYFQRDTPDGRTFSIDGETGFHVHSIHNDVGGGLRFFLRSVAVPLVGFDAGYGIEAHNWRFILIIGA